VAGRRARTWDLPNKKLNDLTTRPPLSVSCRLCSCCQQQCSVLMCSSYPYSLRFQRVLSSTDWSWVQFAIPRPVDTASFSLKIFIVLHPKNSEIRRKEETGYHFTTCCERNKRWYGIFYFSVSRSDQQVVSEIFMSLFCYRKSTSINCADSPVPPSKSLEEQETEDHKSMCFSSITIIRRHKSIFPFKFYGDKSLWNNYDPWLSLMYKAFPDYYLCKASPDFLLDSVIEFLTPVEIWSIFRGGGSMFKWCIFRDR